MRSPEIPGLKKPKGPAFVTVVPKPSEGFLDGPGTADFQIHPTKAIEGRAKEWWEVIRVVKPPVLGALEDFVLFGLQRFVLLPTHFVRGLVEVRHHVEFVEDNFPIGIRHIGLCS